MISFKDFLFKEDPLQAAQQMRQQFAGAKPGLAQSGLGFAVKQGANLVTGGMAGVAMDGLEVIRSLVQKKNQNQVAQSNRLEQQMASLGNLPKEVVESIQINESLFNSLSSSAFITIMSKVLQDLQNRNGNYADPNIKFLFNVKAHEFFKEVFGNTAGPRSAA